MKDFVLSEPWFWVIPNWVQLIFIAVVGYLIGCFSIARIIARRKKKDISKMGSGNPGAMNMTREFGFGIGVLTFIVDAFKAGVPAIIVYYIYNRGSYAVLDGLGNPTFTGAVFAGTQIPFGLFAALLCGVCAVLGHIYPITTGFKGGKGISSGIGLFWLMLGMANPWYWLLGLGLIIVWPFAITLTKKGSLCALCVLAGFCVWQIGALFAAGGPGNIWVSFSVAFAFFVVALSWVAHHKNIRALLSGEEHETVIFKKKGLKK